MSPVCFVTHVPGPYLNGAATDQSRKLPGKALVEMFDFASMGPRLISRGN